MAKRLKKDEIVSKEELALRAWASSMEREERELQLRASLLKVARLLAAFCNVEKIPNVTDDEWLPGEDRWQAFLQEEMANFKRWQLRFDAALKRQGVKEAWQNLIDHKCSAGALKGALYYAATTLDTAQEIKVYGKLRQARERALFSIAELRKTLAELMTHTLHGKPFVSVWLAGSPAKKEDVRLFESFPRLLRKFESTLDSLVPPKTRKLDIEEDATVAEGEALLHALVEETAGKICSAETAVLLEVAAWSYGVEKSPNFSQEAVHKRYRRWFRNRKNVEHESMREFVKIIKKEGDSFLRRVLTYKRVEDLLVRGRFESIAPQSGSLYKLLLRELRRNEPPPPMVILPSW